ncbi:hypothetical protein EVG20_g4129 [Dentipellis fragilis]|uniref:Uncharacterized protein n=1 Tax=Dentipellis fragilis TaxID=205917 RepID=A0A4Y9YX91_9AGAM|nr:hypothetical protein EVG20_g4129 [Dentipellis fragilis]
MESHFPHLTIWRPRQRPSNPAWSTTIPAIGARPTSPWASQERNRGPSSLTGRNIEQEYSRELALSGLCEGPSENLDLSRRLCLLQDYQRAIRMMAGHFRPLPPIHEQPTLPSTRLRVRASATVVSQMQSNGKTVSFRRYPSRHLGIEEESGWLVTLHSQSPFLEHMIDANQDLLVLGEKVQAGPYTDSEGYISLHVLSMRTGAQHPLARRRLLTFPFEWSSNSDLTYEVRICGSQLSVLCVDHVAGNDSTAAVWDWRRAEKRMGPMPRCLDEKSHSYEFGHPEAYDMSAPTISSDLFFPHQVGLPGNHDSPADNLVTIFLNGFDIQERRIHMEIFVPRSTFRKNMVPAQNGAAPIRYRWKKWGPPAAHISFDAGPRLIGRDNVTSCMRYADLYRDEADGKIKLTLHDFNPARVEKADHEPADRRDSRVYSSNGAPAGFWSDDAVKGDLRFLCNHKELPSYLQSIRYREYHPTVTEELVAIHPNWNYGSPPELPMGVFIFN